MQREVLESTKYISKFYFFIGSSLFVPFALAASEWLSQDGFGLNFDIKVLIKIILIIIGILTIKAGCRELIADEERFEN